MALPMHKILIIDDHALFRSGLMLALNRVQDLELFEAGEINQALGLSVKPDLILLDLNLKEENSLLRIGDLLEKWPSTSIFALSAFDSESMQSAAKEKGVHTFLSKSEDTAVIITTVMLFFDKNQTTSKPAPKLTPRQLDMLTYIDQGLTNKRIARKLELSENTVRWHVQSLLASLNANTRSEALFNARKLGII